MKSENKIQLEFEDGSLVTVNKKELDDNFSLLEPNAIAYVSLVTTGFGHYVNKDVIITLCDLHNVSKTDQNLPFAICRQNVIDEMYKIVSEIMKQNSVVKFGISISQKSNPGDHSVFRNFLSCSSQIKTDAVNLYIDDNAEEMIPHFIQSAVFDESLKTNYDINNAINFIGVCQSVKELLKDNNFQDDYDAMFDIFNIKTPIKADGFLSPDQYQEICKEFSLRNPGTPFSTIINTPFSHELVMDDAKRAFMYLRDSLGKLFVVTYV